MRRKARLLGIATTAFGILWLCVWHLVQLWMNEGAYGSIYKRGFPFADFPIRANWTSWQAGGPGVVRAFPIGSGPNAMPVGSIIVSNRAGKVENTFREIVFHQMVCVTTNGHYLTVPAMGRGDGIKVKWIPPFSVLLAGSFLLLFSRKRRP